MNLINLRSIIKLFVISAWWLIATAWLTVLPRAARAVHGAYLVVSEVQISGMTATDEFVELYNPTSTPVSLAGFTLQKLTASGNASNLVSAFPEITIAAHSYLLIAHPTGYDGAVLGDLVYTTTASLAKDNTVVLLDASGAILDQVGFGTATVVETQGAANPENHQSLERLPGEVEGNGTDTNSNSTDFVIRPEGDPQSSAVAPRPALAPPEPESPPVPPSDDAPADAPPPEPTADPVPPPPPPPQEPLSTPQPIMPPATPPPSPRGVRAGDLAINEFVSNPAAGDEWVEIKNISTDTITLGGMTIRDGGSRAINLDGEIAPASYRSFSFSSATLNNSGDAVELLGPDGSVLDTVRYGDWDGGANLGAPEKGESLARFPDGTGVFELTMSPTPAAPNVLVLPPAAPPSAAPNSPQSITTSTETRTAELTAELPPTRYTSGTLLISELYPFPYKGEVEWVEIENPGSRPISLAGWTIADARGTATPLAGELAPRARTAIESPRGHLNNDGDTVTLLDPTGTTIDEVAYSDEVTRGEAWARSKDAWSRTVTPTPGVANMITLPEEEIAIETEATEEEGAASTTKVPPKNSTKKSRTKKSAVLHEVSLEEARELEKGSLVRTTGVVVAPPGIFSARTFYLAGSGMQVYLHNRVEVPTLKIGDLVAVTGKLGSSGGETRLVVSKPDAITVTDHRDAPVPELIEIGEIGDATEGWFVTVEGVVTEKLNGRFILEDASGSVPIVLKAGAGIDAHTAHIGDTVRASGIVSETQSGFRLLPRSVSDLSVIARGISDASIRPRFRISAFTIAAGALATLLVAMVVRKQLALRGAPPTGPLVM
ncbi:lamin tail domain-containing protein [Candidatus Uhrbacteria bacterium]|nr:lamin tail domain-containing protein [Candidatus Uhrbacteria bacterium]